MLITIIRLYELVLIIHIILSWVTPINERKTNKIFLLSERITEPALKPIRIKLVKIFPPIMNLQIDISPIIVFFALSILEGIIKIIFL